MEELYEELLRLQDKISMLVADRDLKIEQAKIYCAKEVRDTKARIKIINRKLRAESQRKEVEQCQKGNQQNTMETATKNM